MTPATAALAARVKAKRPGTMRIMVCGAFTARHRCVEGELHTHTWHVTVWFQPPHRADARIYRAAIDTLTAQLDGRDLPEAADWNEDIAHRFATLCNCVQVRVWREADRLGAEWLA